MAGGLRVAFGSAVSSHPKPVRRFLDGSGGCVASIGSYSTGRAQAIMPHVFGIDFHSFLYTPLGIIGRSFTAAPKRW
ncbi:hypothetical protein C357_01189 [Citreicella sp. 357]|nr:hypothetical protein C357_01189 [Citreicella sp. 357]